MLIPNSRFIPVCGEHVCTGLPLCRNSGSSPRLRGTLDLCLYRFVLERFIPASAGNTPWTVAPAWLMPVHPRVCGEHVFSPPESRKMFGSSPRLRGTLYGAAHACYDLRFIPASAGNTLLTAFAHCNRSVHPRVCGEHIPAAFRARCIAGSSPRLRGTHSFTNSRNLMSRFIPASAGNTSWPSSAPRSLSVHPRVCGEHDLILGFLIGTAGSSPRLRGTLLRDETKQ